ncbi:sensor histidine kinase [Tateyamaria pelophila]|uniref:sensor histidine kinase n=1 Tax=Tateyamaria pelophila TaxID=328415 RepID=UPI001CBEB7DF|nr:ATP-binding protein [Tateyamaria pelophila]
MRFVRSARTRLVIASAFLGFVSIAMMLGLVYWTANRAIEAETRNVVDAELKGLAESYSNLGVLGLARTIDRRISSSEEPDAIYVLTDRYGQTIAGNLGAWPPIVKPGSGWVEIELIRTDTDQTVPISAASISLRNGERLLVGRDASAKKRFAAALGQSVAAALIVAIVVSFIIGWLLTRMVFNRVGELSNTATEIMSGDLTHRMPMREGGDEFDRLALTLNKMLSRIELLVSNLRMTTDSLSHDLRSPLTRLRGHIEVLATTGLTDEERTNYSDRAVEEIDYILRVFTDLTEIARAEAGIGRADFEAIDLATVAKGVADFYGPVAADKGITIRVDGDVALALGNRALLSQAMSNLLENALRYAPVDSVIEVLTETKGSESILAVSDHGEGIPHSDQDRVLQPFVTLDPSRSGGSTGLGLALVAAVARLHGGAITLQDNAPGVTARLTLPTDAMKS